MAVGAIGRSGRTTAWHDRQKAEIARLIGSRYHELMTRQTTVRIPDELADQAEAVARVRGISINTLILESLTGEIERVRSDKDFTERARRLLERDKELIERLAK